VGRPRGRTVAGASLRLVDQDWRNRTVSDQDGLVVDDRTRIDQALREAGQYVERMAPSPGARELKTRLESLRRALDSWDAVYRPTREQADALIEQADEVRRLATDRAPTARRRKVED
jgi:streptomycin 6-kinase